MTRVSPYRRVAQLVLSVPAGGTIMVMTRRRYWLMVCAVQGVVVAGAGCSARELDSPIQPTDGSPPPQGDTWIAFDSDGDTGNRDIYVIRPDGTGRRRLTTESSAETQPSFSRDGKKLAFVSDRDGRGMQVYLMDLATGVTTRVTQRTDQAHGPAFTIDGTRLGYRSGVSVFTALLNGTDERQITNGASCCVGSTFGAPVFPSDGQSMIYDDYNAIYSMSDGPIRQTVVMPTTGEQSHPALSPDGTSIVLQATCGGDNAARSIWTVPATGTTNYSCTDGRRLSPTGTDATHASWGPNNRVVWGSVTGGNNSSSPVPSALVTWQDGTLGTLTSGGGDDRNPSWSPPGTAIGVW
jgi:Tol biopolymer transport system component